MSKKLIAIKRNERLIATIKEIEIDGEKYFYKEYESEFLSIDRDKLSILNFVPIDGIVKPFTPNIPLNGYLMPYMEGDFLSEIIYTMNLDELISSLDSIYSTYFTLGERGFDVTSVNLDELFYLPSENRIINMGVDNITKTETSPRLKPFNNVNALKMALKRILDEILESSKEPGLKPIQEMLNSSVGPRGMRVRPSTMIKQFKADLEQYFEQYYTEGFTSFSSIYGKVGGNDGYSNSRANINR